MKRRLVRFLLLGSMITMMGCGAKGQEVIEMEETSAVALTQELVEETEEMEQTITVQESTEMEKEEVSQEQEEMEQNYRVPDAYAVEKKDVTYGTLETIEYDSTTTGTTRKANIILPAGYDETKKYPVLYLLHGIGGDHNEWMGANPVVLIGNMIASQEAEEMIVVMPNVRARADDAGNPSDIFTPEHFAAFDNFINDLQNDLMPYMEENYPILTGRENTAIAGLSMGGRESLYIGLTMADTFGYVGAFCPAPGVLPYDVEDGLFEEEDFKLPEGYDSLVMIVEGNHDTVVGQWPSTYHKTLEENGVEHVYYVTEGGHDFTVWKHGLYNFAKKLFHE